MSSSSSSWSYITPSSARLAWEKAPGNDPHTITETQGSSLRRLFSAQDAPTTFPLWRRLELFSELCWLLSYLHEQRITHRDLTPDRVLLREDSTLLVIEPLPAFADAPFDSFDTKPIGTIGYASPEQARGENCFEPKSDVFSVGALLYEALTGKIPFRGEGLLLVLATLEQEPYPLTKSLPELPAEVNAFCLRLLSKLPDLRPDAKEAALTLKELSEATKDLSLTLPLMKEEVQAKTPQPIAPNGEFISPSLAPFKTPPNTLPPLDTGPFSVPVVRGQERYQFGDELGRGGLGKVSHAQDHRLNRPVAIKELIVNSTETRERFIREALLTARLQHPSIVPVYDAGVRPNGEIYYSMKLISGKPLDKLIQEAGSLQKRLELLPHILRVAEAIAYAHSQRIIHRDLKPHNILLGEYGETFVIDWGLAKDLQDPSASPSPEEAPKAPEEALKGEIKSSDLTQTGTVVGTPAYMPPEQAQGREVDERADIYALGAILYHLLSGKAPFRGKPQSIIKAVKVGEPEAIEEVEPKAPKDLMAIVQKAMAREPKDRYPDTLSLIRDLKKFETGHLVEAYQYSPWERLVRFLQKNKQSIAIVAAALVVLGVGGGYSVLNIIQERDKAQQRTDELILLQAHADLTKSPARSLSWLKLLPPDFNNKFGAVRIIASDAIRRGVPYPLEGHTGPVTRVAFSFDSTLALSASTDGTVRVWEVATQQGTTLDSKGGPVSYAEFSHDGDLVCSATEDGFIRIWDSHTGALRSKLIGHEGVVYYCAFSPDNTALVSSGKDGTVRVWDLEEQISMTVAQGSSGVTNARFSPDGEKLAFALPMSNDPSKQEVEVRLFDLVSGQSDNLSSSLEKIQAVRVEFSPDGRLLAAVGFEGIVYLWDLQTEKLRRFEGHQGLVYSLVFSPDGQMLASGGQDKKIRVWDVNTGEERFFYKGHAGDIRSLSFSPDGQSLVSASGDTTVQLWDLIRDQHRVLRRHEDLVNSVAFSPNGKFIISGGYDELALLWEAEPDDRRLLFQQKDPIYAVAMTEDGKQIAAVQENDLRIWSTKDFSSFSLGEQASTVTALAFSPNAEWLAVGRYNGEITLWNLRERKSRELPAHEGVVQQLAFERGGEQLASSGNDKIIRVWTIDSADPVELIGHTEVISGLAFSSNQQLFSTSLDRTIKVWNYKTGKNILSIPIDARGLDIDISPDGKKLALGLSSSKAQIWDLEFISNPNYKPKMLQGHYDQVLQARFFINSNTVVTSSADSTLRIWDIESEESSVLEGHSSAVGRLSASDRSFSLVSAGLDGSVRIWWEKIPYNKDIFLPWLTRTITPNISERALP